MFNILYWVGFFYFSCGGGGAFRPTREVFIIMETSPLPLKAFTFWRTLGTHSHWAVMDFCRATHTVTRGIRLQWSSPRTRDSHLLPSTWQWICHYLNIRLRSVAAVIPWEHPTFRMPGERSNPLRYRLVKSYKVY